MHKATMSITFRQAQPDERDVVLPLIYCSGPMQFEYVFTQAGKTPRDFLRWAFTTGAGIFGHRSYTVAVVDQHPVGIGACYGRQEGKALERQVAFQILRFYGLRHAWPVIKRAADLEAVTPFPDPDLDVATTNPRAQALYERLGFAVTHEHRWPQRDLAIQMPDMRRLEFILE